MPIRYNGPKNPQPMAPGVVAGNSPLGTGWDVGIDGKRFFGVGSINGPVGNGQPVSAGFLKPPYREPFLFGGGYGGRSVQLSQTPFMVTSTPSASALITGQWPLYEGQPGGSNQDRDPQWMFCLDSTNGTVSASVLQPLAYPSTTLGFTCVGQVNSSGTTPTAYRLYLDGSKNVCLDALSFQGDSSIYVGSNQVDISDPTANSWIAITGTSAFNISSQVLAAGSPPIGPITTTDGQQGDNKRNLVLDLSNNQAVCFFPLWNSCNQRNMVATVDLTQAPATYTLTHCAALPRATAAGTVVTRGALASCYHSKNWIFEAVFTPQDNSPQRAWLAGSLGFATTLAQDNTLDPLIHGYTRKGKSAWNSAWTLDPATLATVGPYISNYTDSTRTPYDQASDTVIVTVSSGAGLSPANAIDRGVVAGAFADDFNEELNTTFDVLVDMQGANNQIQFTIAGINPQTGAVKWTDNGKGLNRPAAIVDSQTTSYFASVQPSTVFYGSSQYTVGTTELSSNHTVMVTRDWHGTASEGNPNVPNSSLLQNNFVAAFAHVKRYGTFPMASYNSAHDSSVQARQYTYDQSSALPSCVVDQGTGYVFTLIAEPMVVLVGNGVIYTNAGPRSTTSDGFNVTDTFSFDQWVIPQRFEMFRTWLGLTPVTYNSDGSVYGNPVTSWNDISEYMSGDNWSYSITQDGQTFPGPAPSNCSASYPCGEQHYQIPIPACSNPGDPFGTGCLFALVDTRYGKIMQESQPCVRVYDFSTNFQAQVNLADGAILNNGDINNANSYRVDWRAQTPVMKGGISPDGRQWVVVWTFGQDRVTTSNPMTIRQTTIWINNNDFAHPVTHVQDYVDTQRGGQSGAQPIGPVSSAQADSVRLVFGAVLWENGSGQAFSQPPNPSFIATAGGDPGYYNTGG